MSDGDVHASVQVVWRGFTDAEALSHSVCVASECGKLIGSAIIEADVPLIETPVVRGGVKP
jgi:hypothetical protein